MSCDSVCENQVEKKVAINNPFSWCLVATSIVKHNDITPLSHDRLNFEEVDSNKHFCNQTSETNQ